MGGNIAEFPKLHFFRILANCEGTGGQAGLRKKKDGDPHFLAIRHDIHALLDTLTGWSGRVGGGNLRSKSAVQWIFQFTHT